MKHQLRTLFVIVVSVLVLFTSAQSAELKYNCSTPEGIAAMLNDNLEDATITAICESEE